MSCHCTVGALFKIVITHPQRRSNVIYLAKCAIVYLWTQYVSIIFYCIALCCICTITKEDKKESVYVL